MKLKEYITVAALTTASVLSGCKAKPTEQAPMDANAECTKLKQDFKDEVQKITWPALSLSDDCSLNMKNYLILADIRKEMSGKCSEVTDISSYDTAMKGFEFQLADHRCVAKPEKNK